MRAALGAPVTTTERLSSSLAISQVDDGIVWMGVEGLLFVVCWVSLSGIKRPCHGASTDVKFVFYGPHGDSDVVL